MSNRRRTVDDLDDVDDEDGVTEEEVVQATDLTLIVETEDELVSGSDPKLEGPINPDELEEELEEPVDEA